MSRPLPRWRPLATVARVAAVAAALAGAAAARAGAGDAPPPTLLDLQPWRQVQRVPLAAPPGGVKPAALVLANLQPAANAWFVLTVPGPGGAPATDYHLENADPAGQHLALDPARPGDLLLRAGAAPPGGDAGAERCTLWPGDALPAARRSRRAYAPLCGGRLYLRNPVAGHRSALEAGTEFLRDHVWGGEQVIGFVRRELFRDAYLQRAEPAPPTGAAPAAGAVPADAPPPARLADGAGPRVVATDALGLGLDLAGGEPALPLGQWRAVAGLAGVHLSVAQPAAVAPLRAGAVVRPTVAALDAVESQALAFLVAFDLAAFELGFALGTEHPRLGWSARVPPERRSGGGPGPDGIDRAAPLVRTGQLAPALQGRVAATFTGGFKREHGAFRHGALAQVNQGSH